MPVVIGLQFELRKFPDLRKSRELANILSAGIIDMRQRSWWKNSLIEREPSEVANIDRITSNATEKKVGELSILLTLTTLSQPLETITGFMTFGLNLTQDTL